MKRLQYLHARMVKDKQFGERYRENMQVYIDAGYAERAPDDTGVEGMTWYIPHHAVFSAKKPGKLRIVFDCAAEYKGVSINKAVHRGPDLTNKLLGVLLRFREKPYVIVADVEAMYHQVRVPPEHRDVLRFLWYDGDEIVPYRMCVHVFGGVWSASVANFALNVQLKITQISLTARSQTPCCATSTSTICCSAQTPSKTPSRCPPGCESC